jgi:signal transduction histidine kinase
MNRQLHHVNLSIASPSEIEQTARQLMAVREDFLSKGTLLSWTPRPLILDSWQRCRMLDVSPSRRYAPLAVARETQLHQLRENNALLIRAARPIMNHLVDFLADSGYVIVLSDAKGCLLDVAGDAAIRRRLARIDFVPGGNWSEAGAGTNAIGTALADGHVVQLMAAEHYCDGWQDLTCTAAPIHHPLTNEIVGILDVTGNYHLIRPFLTSFLAMLALEIKQRLHLLLSASPDDEWQRRYYSFLMNLPGEIQSTGSNMNKSHPRQMSSELQPGVMPAVDFRLQLNFQERRAYDAERLAAATGVISASLDLDVTLKKVAEQVAHLFHVERAGVVLFNEEGELASTSIWSTLPPSLLTRLPVLAPLLKGSEALSLIQERGEPVVINDVLNSALIPAPSVELGIRSLMLLPLVTARGVSGFITVCRSTIHTWADEDIRLGLAFATQAATAIENARLFDTMQQHNRHVEALNAIAQILSTLPDPGQHLDLVLQRITEIINLDAGMVLLFDQSSDRLTLAAQCRLAQNLQLDLDTFPLKTLHMLARRIIDTRRPLMICADDCDEITIRSALQRVGFYNLIAVPLATSKANLGVLLIGNNDRNTSIREDLKFFSTVGQQLALALNNAQLLRSASETEALREADRLKSSFLAAVSHDLRSPLTAIHTSVESLLDADGIQSATGQEHLLRNIAGQAKRLSQLVDQLLDLSRIDAGALMLDCDWVELAVLIDDAIADFERLHSSCRIERNLAPDLPLHYIDPDRFVQVLWNLLENAFKYAPPSSPIQVTAQLVDNEVMISVADRGPGIPMEEHEKIFQPFYRLDRTHTKGSGLGLAICKGFVEAHGGRIWVEDREGGGSIFRIALHLPVSDAVDLEALEV